ncbi:MAG TPA: sugar phosphate isomerase/epimerase [Opitutaceae bacterium]|nr:sugar phosphate isomerase/epimerase [Opitutaceae bacterium]
MEEKLITRREAIARTALAGLSLPLLGAARGLGTADSAGAAAGSPAAARLSLGLAGYSLRKLPIDAAVAALQELQIKSVSVFRVHVPILLSTPDVCREAARRFRDAGVAIASTGVVTLGNSEGVMRRAFECGRAAGLSTMAASYAEPPDREALLLTERFVREYDMKLAFHNHGPEDKIFPSPLDVWSAVQPYDERLGLCIDAGHSARAGTDPVEAILKCRSRLYDFHIKDTLAGVGEKKDRPAGLGFGRLDIRSIMAALIQVGYRYQVGLEDELETPDPIPGIAQSFGYMRGILAGLPPGPVPA